ncbi:MAG TPA: tetratricopeptide repeat protein [Gemmatimonadales bacterium]|nr:tetratricopeptide repeat protein [Gemmatimonadales bacterium]
MPTSSLVADKAQQLAATGQHAELVEYLGAAQTPAELEQSPTLALLYGTAQARLGRHDEGLRWLDLALDRARQRKEEAVERRALNARGAIALVSGRIDEAADYFTRAVMAASVDQDFATTGRCSNNLGIINHMRGRHAEAIGSWEIAVAAFDRAGLRQGMAECRYNLGITYREQGDLDRALAEADRAVTDADGAGDRALLATALRGRAEIRVARRELAVARRELDEAHKLRTRLLDPVGEAEDLRVVALLQAAEGQTAAAEQTLRDVMARADAQGRPHLLAEATRDLALLLLACGRRAEAQTTARTARALFSQLGAEAEIRALAGGQWEGDFAAELRRSLAPLHEAQLLADTGRYADLLAYLERRGLTEIEQSPMLALLYGIAHGRSGRLDVGQRWVLVAQTRARQLGDRALEVRALNTCGAIALERGGIDEATHFFALAQEEAMHENDMTTVGRCANNLGIVANMQGDYPRAIGAYTRAIAAYQQARYDRGIAESQHNIAIAYREQGQLDAAMDAADTAVRDADKLGDAALKAQALAGRAEVWSARGEPEPAIREVQAALAAHRALHDAVREAEDLRIYAVALGVAGQVREAEATLREVIERATVHERAELVAAAQRDLATLLMRKGDVGTAQVMAVRARATFERLGAMVQIGKLDAILAGETPLARVARPPQTAERTLGA